MIFSGVTILQGVEFHIFPIDFAWALQQCSATALPVICEGFLHMTGNNVLTVVFNSWCPCIYHYTVLSESTGPSSLWHVVSRYQLIYMCQDCMTVLIQTTSYLYLSFLYFFAPD